MITEKDIKHRAAGQAATNGVKPTSRRLMVIQGTQSAETCLSLANARTTPATAVATRTAVGAAILAAGDDRQYSSSGQGRAAAEDFSNFPFSNFLFYQGRPARRTFDTFLFRTLDHFLFLVYLLICFDCPIVIAI